MKTEKKKKCCQGCKKGQPGTNKACQARLLMEKINDQLDNVKPKKS